MVFAIRLVMALVGGVSFYELGTHYLPRNPEWGSYTLFVAVAVLVGIGVGVLVGHFVGRAVARLGRALDRATGLVTASGLIFTSVGLVIGMGVAALGSLAIKDLPAIWNQKMHEYLGITPRNDAEGVLQDVHWSYGSIGYFSTYALGNLISAQVWEKVRRDLPDLESSIRAGKFDGLLQWLRENIHRYGRKFDPQDLVQRVTGSRITPEPYMRYLTSKYSEIYGL